MEDGDYMMEKEDIIGILIGGTICFVLLVGAMALVRHYNYEFFLRMCKILAYAF